MIRHSRVMLVSFFVAAGLALSACSGESQVAATTAPAVASSAATTEAVPSQEAVPPPSRKEYMNIVKQVLDEYEDPAQAVTLKGFTCMWNEITLNYHLTEEAYERYIQRVKGMTYDVDAHETTLEESPWLDTPQLEPYEQIFASNPGICSGTRTHRIAAVSPWVPPAGGELRPPRGSTPLAPQDVAAAV